jgi:protein O-GlcNAc transferase
VEAEKNLRQFAISNGVDSDRLIFAEKIQREAHLQRLQLADLALDTRIVNGAITTSDALWAGVPLVTLQGDHFASRMSSSILMAAQLPELITHTIKDYEDLSVSLARDPNRLNDIRQYLRRSRLTMPLFNTKRFVHNLESAFLEMCEIYNSGDEPRQISVTERK